MLTGDLVVSVFTTEQIGCSGKVSDLYLKSAGFDSVVEYQILYLGASSVSSVFPGREVGEVPDMKPRVFLATRFPSHYHPAIRCYR